MSLVFTICDCLGFKYNIILFYFACPKFVVKDRFEPIELKWSLLTMEVEQVDDWLISSKSSVSS